MRNKEFETLYPVSTALCVSQCPGPIIHSSFPYLSLLRMKDKQKPKSSWLARCFCVKALLLSRPSLHPVPTSLQPWPYIIFQAQCSSSSTPFSLFSPFLYLYENKALLMTVGSQGPAGARALESACAVEKRGAPPPSLPPLLSQVRIEGQEGLMCCCCTEVWAITMAASMSNTKVYFLPSEKRGLFVTCFFGLWVQLHFQIVGWKGLALTLSSRGLRVKRRCFTSVEPVLRKPCPAAQQRARNYPQRATSSSLNTSTFVPPAGVRGLQHMNERSRGQGPRSPGGFKGT